MMSFTPARHPNAPRTCLRSWIDAWQRSRFHHARRHIFRHACSSAHASARSAQLFDWITEGKLRVRIGGEYPVADATRAHADMESRKTARPMTS